MDTTSLLTSMYPDYFRGSICPPSDFVCPVDFFKFVMIANIQKVEYCS